MKHVYPVNCLPSIAHANQSTRQHSSSFTCIQKTLRLLVVLLLLLPLASFGKEKYPFAEHWSDNDRWWTVRYNPDSASIDISMRFYDDDANSSNAGDPDGFINNTHLSYSTDGASFTNFYYLDWEHGDRMPPHASYAENGAITSIIYHSVVNTEHWLDLKLYLTTSLQQIKKIKIVGEWIITGAPTNDDLNATKEISITSMSSVNNPTYEFITVQNSGVWGGKARISYSKFGLNQADSGTFIKLYRGASTAVSTDMPIATSGSYDVDLSSSEQTYYFKQSTYNGLITVQSGSIKVPAFTVPTSASATYDTVSHKATLNWTMNAVTSTSRVNDRFKIQVADNAAFSNATDVSVDYVANQTSFNYYVVKNFPRTLYFRVARNHFGFEWELSQTAHVDITFDSTDRSSVKLEMLPNKTALITWKAKHSAWLPGCTFVIKRINNTAKSETEIRLAEADYMNGSYNDAQIAICNEYTYTIQVQPPVNSDFSASPAIAVNGSILATELGTISNFIGSKGYFPERTVLTWTGNGTFQNFIVKRAVYGTENYVQLATVQGGTNSDFSTDDSKGTPGVYYTYMVMGTATCNSKVVYSDTLYAIGFRSPTGDIYGRVTYESGQAVENVAVRLVSNDQAQLGRSVLLDGSTGSYLKSNGLKKPFEDSALTFEAWIKPTDPLPTNQVLFSRGKQYELGFDGSGDLYFNYNNGASTVTGPYTNENNTYVHVAGVHRKDSMFLLLNGTEIGHSQVSWIATSPDDTVYIGSRSGVNNYKGNIDEIRVWNIALTPARIFRDYTRLLAGDEYGLVAYWRLDETIADQFYDASHSGDQYNKNDGTMINPAAHHDSVIPEDLGLKDYTDASGNYMITGVPFTGSGTSYTVVPLMGIHTFSPSSANRLISTASPVSTVDFKDISSFAVSGTVRYRNSTMPVSGVQFKIDGQLAQKSNGAVIQTESDGNFTISVPVGVHEVQAVKNNHVFLDDGKILDGEHNNQNYSQPLSKVQIVDSTTVRFIGRVAGGPIQEALPLGHSVSVNNLGKVLSISMKLASGSTLASGQGDSTVTINHLVPSNRTSNTAMTTTVYNKGTDQLVVYPDDSTGEFAVDLIPEKFYVTAVNATGWDNFISNQVTIDLNNKFSIQTSIRDYVDTSSDWNGVITTKSYSDTVFYNAAYKFIKRQQPSVALEQLDASDQPTTYFGNETYQIQTFSGGQETVTVAHRGQPDQATTYVYNYPVFNQNQRYTFRIKAFEEYTFFDIVDGVTQPKKINNVTVVDRVPTKDGKVSIDNGLRSGATLTDTLSLDSEGVGIYEFTVGDPDLTNGLKIFTANVRFGQATDVKWKWYDQDQLTAYIMGGKLTGTDFVTAGPDKLLFVLRDPPGSKSFSFAEQGSKITTSSKYSGTAKNVGDEEFTTQVGWEIVTFTGIGVGTINKVDSKTGVGFGIHHEEHYTGSDTKESSTELTTQFKTSDDPLFVGPPGDVFVGYSTNITYGRSNNVAIIKRAEFKPGMDSLFYPEPKDTVNATHFVVKRNGISVGEVFGTLFAYPQQHIEKILIPELLDIRNNMFSSFNLADTTFYQQKANSDYKIYYISKWPTTDSHFGKSNSDTIAFPGTANTAPFGDGPGYRIIFPDSPYYRTDTILVLNQYVAAWRQRLADNEKAKLEAALVQNYSFHSGAPIEYSEESVVKKEHEDEFSFIIGASVTNNFDFEIANSGVEFKFKEDLTTEQGGTIVSSTENTMKYGFTLASEGTDDYFSVDVSKAADSAFVFRTKGGSSGCPYAGLNVTNYYQPGTIIDQPTLRNEVPVISVDNPIANNVPTTRKASFTLKLKNESEAKLAESFMLSYVNNNNIKGATIAVDGLSIADGRTIPVQYGETVEKVLTIERGPEAMDYDNIMILWRSPCQYDPTGYRENIADTVVLAAHFIPSCSDIAITSPKDKWVLNTHSDTVGAIRYLPVKIDQFDANNSMFDHIELQYKPSSTSDWRTVMKFYKVGDPGWGNLQGEKLQFDPKDPITYKLMMDDLTFKDEAYDIQAVVICDLGNSKFVTTESNMVSGIKDTYYPRLFGSPLPANGVLTVNDQVRLNFNETIAAGLLATDNFTVTGIRNGAKTDHSVSVKLNGNSDYLATEFEKSFTGKNITAEAWIRTSATTEQTIFSHGDAAASLEFKLTSDHKLKVKVGKDSVMSAGPVATTEWTHVAMVYNDNSKKVSIYHNWIPIVTGAPLTAAYTGTGHIEFGRSISNRLNYFNGQMHDVRIWNDTLNDVKLRLNSLKVLSGSEAGLLGYWPMNEGKGSVALDKANGSNATLNGSWSLSPETKAVQLNGNGYVKVNTATVPINSDMDYTFELWFNGGSSQRDKTLASNGKGDGTDPTDALNRFSLGFEGDVLTFRNNGSIIQATGTYLDDKWHHVAIAINRNSGSGQLSVDGQLNQFFDAEYVGGIVSDSIYLGARCFYNTGNTVDIQVDRNFTGYIDEFRLWETYLDQNFISKYNNTRLNGDEVGLLAYYPFEYYTYPGGIPEVHFLDKDAKVQPTPSTANIFNGASSNETAPIKSRGPVENLLFDFVVNNDALIINVLEPKASIDKTTITFKAENIKDLHDNSIKSPITWTAYINQNLVKWSDKEINLQKLVGDPLTFTSYLVNNGGNSQHFTISNMPSWLTAAPSSGSVDPNSSQKITFTVSQGLNIGSYEEMIVMHNDNSETEVLKLTLKVKGKQPDWVVKPSDYLYNMVVYGRLRFNNVFSTNTEDMLGAFLSGKCIGVTNNSNTNNDWYAFLTMYSNDVTNTNIEFRLWEAKTGKIYIATPSTAISFNNNTVVGTVAAPVIFDASATNYRNIVLNQNWNWVSFNLMIPNNTSLNTTLQDGNWTMDDQIKNEAAGTFASFTVTNGAGWAGTLKALDNLTAYKLKVAVAQSLPVNGTAVDVTAKSITLKGNPAWSYISYLPPFNATVKEALAGYTMAYSADGDVIKSQTGFAMYSSAANAWIGSLTYMEPGKGYMFLRKATTTASFKYPIITGSLQGGRVIQGPAATAEQRPVPANFTHADNMTVIAIVSPTFDLRTGDSIIAYVNGEVRGKAKPILNPEINKYTWFFTIAGDAEQSVVFVVVRDGNVIAESSTIVNYSSNKVVGTLTKPLELQFVKLADLITVNPNPFRQFTTINIDLSRLTVSNDQVIQLSVFDVSGRTVWGMPMQKVSGPKYTATWNGQNHSGAVCSSGVYVIQVAINGVPYSYKLIKQ